METKEPKAINNKQDNESVENPSDPSRRKALEKLVKYTPPAMVVLLTKDSAWAQISGGPPPPPSDIRLKTDIHEVGLSDQGHQLYRFKYLNDADQVDYVGLMAQDLIDHLPDAVTTSEDGYYAVYYDRLGLKMTTYEKWQEQGLNSVQLCDK